ncbi:hypothetical protein V5F53_16725 [Xanthobacter sp. V4C-4]|uniref:hypothetical protein n=1 Tax=Xanthobacter cornucopiae TaxID=3119924 RepID=UPI00372822BB
MPSLHDMALVDLRDGQGPRHIPGVSWSPVTRRYAATLDDPQGRPVFLGSFDTPGQALTALDSMKATFAKLGNTGTGTRVGGPRPE